MPQYDFIKYVTLAENKQEALRIDFSEVEPVLSRTSMEYHYNVLYKKYLENSVDDPSDDFAIAGALLHRLFFEQMNPVGMRSPHSASKELINKNYGSYIGFKHEITEEALLIQGSGWIYLDTSGHIKIIKNHEIVDDVALIIDCWEHTYYTDYGPDKESYLNNIWKIIDWDVVNARLT